MSNSSSASVFGVYNLYELLPIVSINLQKRNSAVYYIVWTKAKKNKNLVYQFSSFSSEITCARWTDRLYKIIWRESPRYTDSRVIEFVRACTYATIIYLNFDFKTETANGKPIPKTDVVIYLSIVFFFFFLLFYSFTAPRPITYIV